jgi:hypothetical protein
MENKILFSGNNSNIKNLEGKLFEIEDFFFLSNLSTEKNLRLYYKIISLLIISFRENERYNESIEVALAYKKYREKHIDY